MGRPSWHAGDGPTGSRAGRRRADDPGGRDPCVAAEPAISPPAPVPPWSGPAALGRRPRRRPAAVARLAVRGVGFRDAARTGRGASGRAGRRGGRGRRCVRCPHLAETRTQTVFGSGSPDGPADVRRRGARGRRRPARAAVRRPRRPAAHRHDHQGHGPVARGGLHRQHPQVPSAREPHAHARGGRQLLVVPRTPDRRHPARVPLPARQDGRHGRAGRRRLRRRWDRLRGRWHRYRGIRTLVTYHPSRSGTARRRCGCSRPRHTPARTPTGPPCAAARTCARARHRCTRASTC